MKRFPISGKLFFLFIFIFALRVEAASAQKIIYGGYTFLPHAGDWSVQVVDGQEVMELIHPYSPITMDEETYLILDKALPESYWYRFKANVIAGSHFHTLFNTRIIDGNLDSYYQMSIRFSSNNINIKKKESGDESFTLYEAPRMAVLKGRWIDCMIVKQGKRILVFVDDMEVPRIDIRDPLPLLNKGNITLGFKYQSHMLIKDFEYHSESYPFWDIHMEYPDTTSIRLGEKLRVRFVPDSKTVCSDAHLDERIGLYGSGKAEEKKSVVLPRSADGSFLWEYVPEKEGVYEAAFILECNGRKAAKREYFCVVDTEHQSMNGKDIPPKEVADIVMKPAFIDDYFRHNGKGRYDSRGYWESGKDKNDYLAVRLHVKNKDLPHMIKIEYPDDSARSMSFSLLYHGRRPDDIGGVHTGFDIPVSGTRAEYSSIFWPKGKEFTLMAMNWWDGHRAAISRVRLYAMKSGLPESSNVPIGKNNHRSFGIWNEDPNGILAPLDISSIYEGGDPPAGAWYEGLDRLSKYIKYLGLNTVYYPVLWYDIGSTFPAKGIGRKIGWPPNRYYDDYIKLWCLFGEKYGYDFHAYIVGWGQGDLIKKAIPSFPLYDNPSGDVRQRMQESLPGILAGRDTVAMMDNQNRISQGGRGSIGLNPLHPEIRKAFDIWLNDLLSRYGKLPAFKGIDIQLSPMTNLFCFNSENSGYEDYTVGLFEKETGIIVPGQAPDPERFNKRYEWLRKNNWEAWLNWRSDHVAQILQDIEHKVHGFRRDLDVDFDLYTFWAALQEEALKGNYTNLPIRDNLTGVDLEKLSKIKGTRILRRVSPEYDRYYLTQKKNDPSRFMTHRWAFEHPILDRYSDGAFFYYKYYEYRYRGEKRDLFKDIEKQGPLSAYLRYNERYCLSSWVRQVVNIDPSTIIFGGFGLTSNGAEDFVAEFAKNFIPVPQFKFNTPFKQTQPVTFRTLKKDGHTYFYVANDTAIPAKVEISLDGSAHSKIYSNNDSSYMNEPKNEGMHNILDIDMPIYSLRSFHADEDVNFMNIKVTISDHDEEMLRDRILSIKDSLTGGKDVSRDLWNNLWEAFMQKRYRDLSIALEDPVLWKIVPVKGVKE